MGKSDAACDLLGRAIVEAWDALDQESNTGYGEAGRGASIG